MSYQYQQPNGTWYPGYGYMGWPQQPGYYHPGTNDPVEGTPYHAQGSGHDNNVPVPHHGAGMSYGYYQPQFYPQPVYPPPMPAAYPAAAWHPEVPASNVPVEPTGGAAPATNYHPPSYAMRLWRQHDTITPHTTAYSATTPVERNRGAHTRHRRGPGGTPYVSQEPARIVEDGVVVNEDAIDAYWNQAVPTMTERQGNSQYNGEPTARETEFQRLQALNPYITTKEVMDTMLPPVKMKNRPGHALLIPPKILRFRLEPYLGALSPTQLVALAVAFEILEGKRDSDHHYKASLAYLAVQRIAPDLIRSLPDLCGRCAERGFRGCWYIYPYSLAGCIQCGANSTCSHGVLDI
ncbi:uncharacterized protein LOC62_07G008918 [Vanrija pseudolonga]|uniref:Uncharacterized protein n=1 Tax=Vanrija pseudolonga TaxID=143232 RepID=A0AAF0YJX4_9TREE|nr:hypothetical protein LOC62_07G008918 [Vanrija pseudolonga]